MNDSDESKVGIDGNVHVMPVGTKEHEETWRCWCWPELIDDYSDYGGTKIFLHKEIQ